MADPTGKFTLVSPVSLPDGPITFSARATDAVGNHSEFSAGAQDTIDGTAPAAPVITTPSDGTRSEDTTTLVAGSAEPGTRVEIFDGGTFLASTFADRSSGYFQVEVPQGSALGFDTHVISAEALDAVGNRSPPSNTVIYVVTDVTPPRISVLEPLPRTYSIRETTTIDVQTTDNLSGVDPASLRIVLADPFGDTPLANGQILVMEELGLGAFEFRASAADVAGNVDTASRQFTVADDVTPIADITQPTGAEPDFSDTVIEVRGTATDSFFLSYELRAFFEGPPDSAVGLFTATPTTAVVDGLLGSFDVGALEKNGTYRI